LFDIILWFVLLVHHFFIVYGFDRKEPGGRLFIVKVG
jgi:hypothetical protein